MHGLKIKGWLVAVIIVQWLVFSRFGVAQDELSIEPFTHFGGYVGYTAVQGNYTFLGQGTVLTVLNNSGENFVKVASLELPQEPRKAKISGDYLYLYSTGSDSALQIVDISNPLKPLLISRLGIQGRREGALSVSENYLCLALEESLKVIDISDPVMPAVIATYETSLRNVFATDSLVYLAGLNGMAILDLTDPQNPIEIGAFNEMTAVSIFVQDNFAYVGGTLDGKKGMQIVDISDPQNPVPQGFFETAVVDGAETHSKFPEHISVENNLAYIGGIDWRHGDWLFIVDVSDPANPTESGALDLMFQGAQLSAQSMQVQGDYAYLATGANSIGLLKINVADPAHPEVEALFEEPWDIQYLCTRGKLLYVSSWDRLWIYDYTDPDNPALLGSDTTWAKLTPIHVYQNYLYGLQDNQLHILDITDPGNIFEVGNYTSTHEKLREVKVFQNYAYLLGVDETQSNLEIVDISNFENIVEISKFALPGEGRDFFVQGENALAYVAYFADETNQGVQIIDIAQPAAPVEKSTTQTSGKPICLWVADTTAFIGSNLADSTWFIESFNVTDGAAPEKLASNSGPGLVCDIQVVGDLVLASIPTGSMYVFDFKDMTLKMTCHSPYSAYFAVLWHGIYHSLYIFTIDGWYDIKKMIISASLGVFGQKLQLIPKAATIKIAPGDTNVEKGKKIQFTALGLDSSGNKIVVKTKWSSSGGNINTETGLFTASEEGSFTVTADDLSGTATGTATVHVNPVSVTRKNSVVTQFGLSQNYPNPFNPTTRISFQVKEKCRVSLRIYDIRGQEIATLANREFEAGNYSRPFNAQHLPSGVYFYRIRMKDFQAVKKMVLLE